MKKLALKAALMLGLFFLLTNSASAQGGCLNEQQAIAIARQDCPNAPPPAGNHYEAYLVSTPLCMQGSPGCAMVFDVYYVYECPPQVALFCRPLPPVKIATVVENCDGSRVAYCD